MIARTRSAGDPGDELRVELLLEQDGDEPVLQVKVELEDLAPGGVRLQRALAGEHGLADPLTVHQLAVEDRDEPPRRLHEHGMAHGHDRGDAPLQQLARHRGVRANVGHRGLAGFEEDQRHAVVAHDPGKLLGVDDLGPALLGLGGLPWVLEAEGAQAVFAVVNPVAVEMHDVVGAAPRRTPAGARPGGPGKWGA